MNQNYPRVDKRKKRYLQETCQYSSKGVRIVELPKPHKETVQRLGFKKKIDEKAVLCYLLAYLEIKDASRRKSSNTKKGIVAGGFLTPKGRKVRLKEREKYLERLRELKTRRV